MVLLVVGLPILVLVLALALERLETRLLPPREVDLPYGTGDVRPGSAALASPRDTSSPCP